MFFTSTSLLAIIQRSKKVLLTSLILSLGLLLGFYTYTKIVSEPKNIDRLKSASFRINTWQQGLDIFYHSPLLGVGFNNYQYALKQFNLADENFLNSHGSTSNDSSLLFVLATTGILGLFAFSLFIFFLIKSNLVSFTVITVLIIHSIFNNSLFYPPILLSIILIATSKFSKR